MMKAVVVERVIKVYESRGESVTALREVSFDVERGEVVAIMGPSGSGKTTLLNLIGGIDKPTAGRVVVDGVEVHRLGEGELRAYRLSKVGYVFQQYNLIPTLTALENVLLPMQLARRSDKARALELLKRVDLEGKESRLPEELSGGEQQRLAIAVALANDPPLLIADEPTGELDLATGQRVVELILSQARDHGKTVIMTTHDPRVARQADRVILLEDGRVKGVYEPQRLATEYSSEAEVHVERMIVDYLKSLLDRARRELGELEARVARGEIGLGEALVEYQRLSALIAALEAELARLGAGVEA